jgi:hypothetical protein
MQSHTINIANIIRSLNSRIHYIIMNAEINLKNFSIGQDIDLLCSNASILCKSLKDILCNNIEGLFGSKHVMLNIIHKTNNHIHLDIIMNNRLLIKFDIWSCLQEFAKCKKLLIDSKSLIRIALCRRKIIDNTFFLSEIDQAFIDMLNYKGSKGLKTKYRNSFSNSSYYVKSEVVLLSANYIRISH